MMGWMVLGQFIAAVAFVTLWAVGFAHRASVGAAVLFGVLVGLFYSANSLITFAVQPIPGQLIFRWIVAGVLQATVMGLLLLAICRPKSDPGKRV